MFRYLSSATDCPSGDDLSFCIPFLLWCCKGTSHFLLLSSIYNCSETSPSCHHSPAVTAFPRNADFNIALFIDLLDVSVTAGCIEEMHQLTSECIALVSTI